MRTCTTCGKSINRGSTAAHQGHARCLVCLTAEVMRDWRYLPRYAYRQRVYDAIERTAKRT